MPKTGREIKMLAYRRNASLGQLCMARSNLKNMINTEVISKIDSVILEVALANINLVLKQWDRHYIRNKMSPKYRDELDDILENVRTLEGASL